MKFIFESNPSRLLLLGPIVGWSDEKLGIGFCLCVFIIGIEFTSFYWLNRRSK